MLWRASRRMLVVRNEVNSAGLISPEAMAKSRCRTAPLPEACPIGCERCTVGSAKMSLAHSLAHQCLVGQMSCKALPQSTRCFPRCQSSPNRVTAGLLSCNSGISSSASLSLFPSRMRSISGILEAGDRDVKGGVDCQQMLKFDRQNIVVPAGLLRQLVVGENVDSTTWSAVRPSSRTVGT